MTKVGSFLYLLHSCRERETYLSPVPVATDKTKQRDDGDFYLLDSANNVDVDVPFNLSSLFPCSRVVSFLMDVFSEGVCVCECVCVCE